jgi:hypothetical protein
MVDGTGNSVTKAGVKYNQIQQIDKIKLAALEPYHSLLW